MADDLRSRANKMGWFHALDLGGFQTSGRFPPGTPQNRTLFPAMDMLQHVDFNGLDCLDIGTVHGVSAFGMKMRGAKRVVATDVSPQMSPPWALAREALKLDVEYVPDTRFTNILERLKGQKFDVIVCAGVIYHMFDPFDAVLKCRQLLKPNGLLLLESAYDSKEKRAILDFSPHSGTLKEIYTYWVPSRLAMLGMLRLTGFNPLAERWIINADRLAIIAENVAWNAVEGRTALMTRMHEKGVWATDVTPEPEGPPSKARYTGPRDAQLIDWQTYAPNWPPHPKAMQNVVGKTK